MAGNNGIKFLRGTSSLRRSSTAKLLYGQPFYEADTNLLYIGGKDGTTLNGATPIGHSIQYYWDCINWAWVREGDCAFIELLNGNIVPARCVNIDNQYNITWQVNYPSVFDMGYSLTWGETTLFNQLNTTIINLFPSTLAFNIVPVVKSSGTYSNTSDPGTESKLWIPSAEEIFGQNGIFPSGMSRDSGSVQFGYYRELLGSNRSATGYNPELRSVSNCWLRNRYLTYNSQWFVLKNNGDVEYTSVGAFNQQSAIFCFTMKIKN